MMIDQTARILNAIYAAIDELNQQLPADKRLSKTPDTVLYAKSGVLDSLGFVNLILAVEESIEDEFGLAVNIADKVATASEANPFRTVATLTEYIEPLIEGETSSDEAF
ncbi:MAG: acyl carrier protein [Chloroflexi bacterium]|nr:acyl carrier protein [Chloroflexota bacterium]